MLNRTDASPGKTVAIELLTEQIRQFDALAGAVRKVGALLWLATPLAITAGFDATFRRSVELVATLLSQQEAFRYVSTVLTAHRYIDYELWDAVKEVFPEEAAAREAELFEPSKRKQEMNQALKAFLQGFRGAPFPVREIQTCREHLQLYKMTILHTWQDAPGEVPLERRRAIEETELRGATSSS